MVTIATLEQAGEVRTLAKQAGISPTITAIAPGAKEIATLRGERAAHVTPVPIAAVSANEPRRSNPQRKRPTSSSGGSGHKSRNHSRSQSSRRPNYAMDAS